MPVSYCSVITEFSNALEKILKLYKLNRVTLLRNALYQTLVHTSTLKASLRCCIPTNGADAVIQPQLHSADPQKHRDNCDSKPLRNLHEKSL